MKGQGHYKVAAFLLQWKRYEETKLKGLLLSLAKRVYNELFIETYTGPMTNIHEATNLIGYLNSLIGTELCHDYPLRKVQFLFPDIYNSPPLLFSTSLHPDAIFHFPGDLSWISPQLQQREKLGLHKPSLSELEAVPLASFNPIKSPYALEGVDEGTKVFPYKTSAVGGTFDRPHVGHKILLSLSALLTSTKLYVGLTHESLLTKKAYKESLQSYNTRRQGVERFLQFLSPKLLVEVHPLYDPVGIAGTAVDLEALLVTTETVIGGDMVQKERLKNGLKAVSLPVLGFEKIEVAKKISSTEVRASVVAKAQTDLETLKGFWSETMKGLKVGKELEMKWWDILTDLYSQDWRYYHVLKHVKNMLIIAKDHKEKLKHFPGFELAAWFHDSVYYPALAKNEEESSKLFKEFSKEAGIDEKLAEYVTNLIIATESHSIKSDAEYDTKLFVDTDLSILGETKEDYEKYAECVRKEYSHVSKEEYEKGRLAVLNKFLKEGSPLFNTEEMREKYEARARENIMNEIKTLS